MPHLTLWVDPEGLLLDVVVGLTGQATASLVAGGQPIPRPLLLRGQIDNGSNITCVAARVFQHFGLNPILRTTSLSTGGRFGADVYEVSFSIPQQGSLPGPLLVLESLDVMELVQPLAGIEVLVGLDVLDHLLVVHDGPRREFTLGD